MPESNRTKADNTAYYREQAAQCAKSAASVMSAELRLQYLELAQHWRSLADFAERDDTAKAANSEANPGKASAA